jgi:cytochrome P450
VIPLRCPIIITDALIYLPAGDLAFGEGFGCLQNADYHPWVRNIFGNVKALSFMQACMQYQTIMKLLHWCIPPSLQAKRRKHYEFSENRAKHRMEADSSRKDFMSYILKHNDKKGGITDDEITANAAVLTLAGSETTATLLSGLTYHLLKNPEALRKLTAEIRSAFATEDEIDFKSVASLKYMLACLEEGLRMYPPVPVGLPRRVPAGGDTIIGHYVPEGVRSLRPTISIIRNAY